MNSLQKLYELKSRMLNKSLKIDPEEYFKFIDQIRSRPNLYTIPQEKISIKSSVYTPFKDPFIIQANKKNKSRIYSILGETPSPRLNYDYLEVREKNRNSREKYREMAERALSLENAKFQDRVFNQKTRIDEIKNFNIKRIKLIKYSGTKDYESDYRKYIRKTREKDLILPNINSHKQDKSEKIFQTEVHSKNNSLTESNIENGEKMKDHKYKDISHQRQGHLQG